MFDKIKAIITGRNHGGQRAQTDLVVMHSMESGEDPTVAERVAAWFAGATSPQVSVHALVDSDSIVQGMPDDVIAWHAAGVNLRSVGIEQAGRAEQTRAQWLDDFSQRTITNAADIAAYYCKRYNIPPVFVSAAEINAGKRGITTHAEVCKATGKGGGHWDPGPNYPMDQFLAQVRLFLSQQPATPSKPPAIPINDALVALAKLVSSIRSNPLRRGATGDAVKLVQKLLRAKGFSLDVDGDFGPQTENAVRQFQQRAHLVVDGIVGAATINALAS